ncbi:hypothetical protein MMC25_000770 [Agyrium rufum]|nr:hypothetical protein [Agyrium rufum]
MGFFKKRAKQNVEEDDSQRAETSDNDDEGTNTRDEPEVEEDEDAEITQDQGGNEEEQVDETSQQEEEDETTNAADDEEDEVDQPAPRHLSQPMKPARQGRVEDADPDQEVEEEEPEVEAQSEDEVPTTTRSTIGTRTSKSKAVVDNEDEDEQVGDAGGGDENEEEEEDDGLSGTPQPVTPGRLARTNTTPITTTEKAKANNKVHPPIKLYSGPLDTWHPMIATIDTGCEDDWISWETVQNLGLEEEMQDPDPDDEFVTFSGESMSSVGVVYITWSADSTGKTNETAANVAENGPFSFLIGSNFYMNFGLETFSEPVQILRPKPKKPSTVDITAAKDKHNSRVKVAKDLLESRKKDQAEERDRLRKGHGDDYVSKTSKLQVDDDEDE